MTEAHLPILLLVDDDAILGQVLQRALGRRGFHVVYADGIRAAQAQVDQVQPSFAVLDLKLGDGSGLQLVSLLRQRFPAIRMLMLTGYASLATAVEAIKLGADDYLAKPVDADQIVAALRGEALQRPADRDDTGDDAMSMHRLEWEHIQRVLNEVQGNISEAARVLGMHRRTLQRKLLKRPSPGQA